MTRPSCILSVQRYFSRTAFSNAAVLLQFSCGTLLAKLVSSGTTSTPRWNFYCTIKALYVCIIELYHGTLDDSSNHAQWTAASPVFHKPKAQRHDLGDLLVVHMLLSYVHHVTRGE